MPHAAIYRRQDAKPDDKAQLLKAVNRAMIEVLKVPEDTHPVRLNEYPEDAFLIPEGCSVSFTLIEATLFAGRTPKTKKALFHAIIESMGGLGIDAEDIRVVIYDVPRENWGLKGASKLPRSISGSKSRFDRFRFTMSRKVSTYSVRS